VIVKINENTITRFVQRLIKNSDIVLEFNFSAKSP